ncbi:MAG: hypothetical protein ACFE9S_12250 [Candidatus Hermodarchaeota archaeon]
MSKKPYKGLIFNIIIFIALLLIGVSSQNYIELNYQEEKMDLISPNNELIVSQGPNNDTTAPDIMFIQPEINNTIIKTKSYTIIANITDENPPLFGNVTIQISNLTNFLFNVSMMYDGGSQWSFTWDNISLYPNNFYHGYIIQIVAIDSSSDRNLGMSDAIYIYLNVSGDTPGILNIFLYLIIVCLLFALIIVYLNKRILRKVSGKGDKNNKGVYKY